MEERPFSDISYGQFLNEEKIMGTKCKKCDALYAPPRPICIKCHSSEMDWVEMKGEGKLSAFTCIAVGPPFMIAEGYNRKNLYISGVVELEEGVRVDARIEGVDGNRPEEIKVGMSMKAKFLHRGEGEDSKTYLAFEPE
ncbi:MAG: Zn-ribbon domain-containing OB-fold protein [Proteobacteria bacterium]|nr:Zn-ribbon domain-containing OB-fold protein [Pseudomonadota bacterium]